MSGVSAYVFSTRDAVASWKVSGSTLVVHATVYLSGRIIPVVFFGGGVISLERNYSGFGLQHRELEKSMCFIFYQNF